MTDTPRHRTRRFRLADVLTGWRLHHGQVARDSLRRLLSQPISSLMTWLVIGIALALPASLNVALDNIQRLGSAWDSSARLSVYLKLDVSDDAGLALSQRLKQDALVSAVQYTDREAALAEFRDLSGFGDLLDGLSNNPLPAVISVEPLAHQPPEALAALQERLTQHPEVDNVQLDLEWVQRLQALVALGQRLAFTLAALLSLGVVLVIGNTIRLAIESRREEIVIVKLVGGTDAFVRRPFLYTGLWYGLGGGLCAWLIVLCSLWWIDGAVSRLSGLYGSGFALTGPGFSATLILWLSGGLLGLAGAWLAVTRHLGAIEPT